MGIQAISDQKTQTKMALELFENKPAMVSHIMQTMAQNRISERNKKKKGKPIKPLYTAI